MIVMNNLPLNPASNRSCDAESLDTLERNRTTAGMWHFRRRGLIGLDIVCSAAAILGAYAMFPGFSFTWQSASATQPGPFQATIIYTAFLTLSGHVAGLHDPLGQRKLWTTFARATLAVLGALGLALLLLYFVSLQQLGRTILLHTALISVVLLTGARLMLWHFAGTTPRRIGYYVKDKSRGGLRNLISMSSVHLKFLEVPSATGVSDWDGVAQQLADLQVDEIIVVSRDNQRDLWIACLRKGLQVTDIAVFIEREYYKIACDEVDLKWILSIDLKWNHPFYHRFKRLMDIAIALIGIVFSAPIFFAAALLIVGQSGFPILYSQTRVGLRGRSYLLWKLRTMRNDAEAKGPQWAQKQDGRVTRIGRILRLTRIDELPQFWNVLRGDMSFIGPRPERPEFVEKLSSLIPLYSQRHWVKPGITGWAQINYPYGASVEDAREKLCYDLYYMKNASLLLDLHIGLRTIGAVMKGSR